jgi:hypothetical protein
MIPILFCFGANYKVVGNESQKTFSFQFIVLSMKFKKRYNEQMSP